MRGGGGGSTITMLGVTRAQLPTAGRENEPTVTPPDTETPDLREQWKSSSGITCNGLVFSPSSNTSSHTVLHKLEVITDLLRRETFLTLPNHNFLKEAASIEQAYLPV